MLVFWKASQAPTFPGDSEGQRSHLNLSLTLTPVEGKGRGPTTRVGGRAGLVGLGSKLGFGVGFRSGLCSSIPGPSPCLRPAPLGLGLESGSVLREGCKKDFIYRRALDKLGLGLGLGFGSVLVIPGSSMTSFVRVTGTVRVRNTLWVTLER